MKRSSSSSLFLIVCACERVHVVVYTNKKQEEARTAKCAHEVVINVNGENETKKNQWPFGDE